MNDTKYIVYYRNTERVFDSKPAAFDYADQLACDWELWMTSGFHWERLACYVEVPE